MRSHISIRYNGNHYVRYAVRETAPFGDFAGGRGGGGEEVRRFFSAGAAGKEKCRLAGCETGGAWIRAEGGLFDAAAWRYRGRRIPSLGGRCRSRRPEREGERVTQRSDKVVDATRQAEGAKIA